MQNMLNERRKIWQSKKILQKIYTRWYGIISGALSPGNILELGGGSGNLKEFFPNVITSDIVFASWLDASLDAHRLPFKNQSLDNIVLFDVLHHLSSPEIFFNEAMRVLKPNGKLIMMEPYVSWSSFLIYRFLHTEGMDWKVNPFYGNASSGNQAIPTLIFEKYRKEFLRRFPGLKIIKEEKMDPLLYPLSGGFNKPNLCPLFLWPVIESLEILLHPLNDFLAFRLFIVIEK